MSNSNRNIVIIGLQPWYTDIGSNCKHIATEWVKTHQVLYVNIPINRKSWIRQNKHPEFRYHADVIKGKKPAIIQIDDHFWNLYPPTIHESINWVKSARLFDWLNKINNQRLAKDIQWAIKQLGFRNYVLFNDNDIFRGFYLKELLQPNIYVYYCRDYLRAVPYFKYHADRLEPIHIQKADLAVANSHYLEAYLKQYNTNSYYTGQGCNLSLFNGNKTYDTPPDIQNIPRPRIGYVGNLYALRIDEQIIHHIAIQKKEWHIVLIGPEDENFQKSSLHRLPNVHFLGKKTLESLPGYIQSLDVCINPQKINEMTIGNYPLKIDEYLAMGKPVVATSTQAMNMFEKYCYLANVKEDYPALIEKAIQENNNSKIAERIAFASEHTWENVASKIWEYILFTEEKIAKNLFKTQDPRSETWEINIK
ncbi:MAG: glycosyltransferase [Thermoflavifilum sp.]|nr:glycosyltransferase [Thermoflavifilum sp.]